MANILNITGIAPQPIIVNGNGIVQQITATGSVSVKGDKGATGATGPAGPAGATDYNALLNKPDLTTKQDTLVSGTNIKTINGSPLLGSGNLVLASGTGDKNYTQSFTGLSVVNVAHNLSKYPAVQVFDSAFDQCEGTVRHTDLNNLTLTFSASFTGTVTCN